VNAVLIWSCCSQNQITKERERHNKNLNSSSSSSSSLAIVTRTRVSLSRASPKIFVLFDDTGYFGMVFFYGAFE
jgi:hypothetical protein